MTMAPPHGGAVAAAGATLISTQQQQQQQLGRVNDQPETSNECATTAAATAAATSTAVIVVGGATPPSPSPTSNQQGANPSSIPALALGQELVQSQKQQQSQSQQPHHPLSPCLDWEIIIPTEDARAAAAQRSMACKEPQAQLAAACYDLEWENWVVPTRIRIPQQTTTPSTPTTNDSSDVDASLSSSTGMVVLATVDTPHYRQRRCETLQHLQNSDCGDDETTTTTIPIHSIDLLRQSDCPNLSSKKILYEGWRQILVPRLMELLVEQHQHHELEKNKDDFVLVLEDDVRLVDGLTLPTVWQVCRAAFRAHARWQILSLGHAWRDLHPRRQRKHASLQQHLRAGHGVHASTALAVRVRALPQLQTALRNSKATHWDQFVFHSTQHDLVVALLDPPLAGWCEVDTTLTPAGSGQRRRGGGRKAFVPPPWIFRGGPNKNDDDDDATTTTTTWVVRRRRERTTTTTTTLSS